MTKKPKTLKEIAIELLEKYEASETTVICEYSTNIGRSEELLKKEVAKYRKMIDKAERKDEPTISKMEQVDKDINVRSKDEPQRDIHCSNCKYHDKYGCEPPCDTCEGMSKHKPKTEPQTERSE